MQQPPSHPSTHSLCAARSTSHPSSQTSFLLTTQGNEQGKSRGRSFPPSPIAKNDVDWTQVQPLSPPPPYNSLYNCGSHTRACSDPWWCQRISDQHDAGPALPP